MCNHEYDLKADGVTRQMHRTCGAFVCYLCDDHEGLAHCYCGWSRFDGDGRYELIMMGENVDDDYNPFDDNDGMWDY